jgi:hypothetical protein
MISYNPYGRAGGGAPIRDEYGHIVATRVGYFSITSKSLANQLRHHSPTSLMSAKTKHIA